MNKNKKFWRTYTLLGELLLQYPKSLDEVYLFLTNTKKFYKSIKEYQTQKSIEQEYVVGENDEQR